MKNGNSNKCLVLNRSTETEEMHPSFPVHRRAKVIPCRMAATLRLSEEEQDALQERAATEGISMQDVARKAVRAYLASEDRRERILAAGKWVTENHADVLMRLGK